MSLFKRPVQLKVTDLDNFLNAATRNIYNSLSPPLSSFPWPIIVLIIYGIAITFLFLAVKENVAKDSFIMFRAQPWRIWCKPVFKTLKFWVSNYSNARNTMPNFVGAWKSWINREVQLSLYFCKELHKIFALTNRSQKTCHSNSVVFSDIGRLSET